MQLSLIDCEVLMPEQQHVLDLGPGFLFVCLPAPDYSVHVKHCACDYN